MAALTPAPTTVLPNGQHVVTALGPQHLGHTQNLEGGLIQHAATKTANSIRTQAGHAAKAGVTMRGSSRRFKGGAEIQVPSTPEGGTIPGVSFKNNHVSLVNGLNKINTGALYDKMGSAQPYAANFKGGKRRRKTNGRSKHRNIHRRRSKHSRRTRRRNKTHR
jgi:hypothetical protein